MHIQQALSLDKNNVKLCLTVSFFVYFNVFRVDFHCIQDVGDELVLVIRRDMLFSFNHPVFLACPASSHHVPHIPSIVPTPLMLPSSAVFGIFFHHSYV